MDDELMRDLARAEALARQIGPLLKRSEELMGKSEGDTRNLPAEEKEEAERIGEELLPIVAEMLAIQRRNGWDDSLAN